MNQPMRKAAVDYGSEEAAMQAYLKAGAARAHKKSVFDLSRVGRRRYFCRR